MGATTQLWKLQSRMDDNRGEDLFPDNAAGNIISFPPDIDTDDDIVHIYQRNNSQPHLSNNQLSVSHQLTEDDYPALSRPITGMTNTERYTFAPPVPMTPVPPHLTLPPYSQVHPRLGAEQVRPIMDRLPSPNQHQPPENRLGFPNTRATQPHDMQRQERDADRHFPRYSSSREIDGVTDPYSTSNFNWQK